MWWWCYICCVVMVRATVWVVMPTNSTSVWMPTTCFIDSCVDDDDMVYSDMVIGNGHDHVL